MNKEIEEAAKAFDNNSDCYADTNIYLEGGRYREGEVVPAMTKEKFLKVITEWQSQQPLTVKPVPIETGMNLLTNADPYIDEKLDKKVIDLICRQFDSYLEQLLASLTPAPVQAVEGETITDNSDDFLGFLNKSIRNYEYFDGDGRTGLTPSGKQTLSVLKELRTRYQAQQPQPQLKWVKATDRMPTNSNTVVLRFIHTKRVIDANTLLLNQQLKEVIEWLDESYEPGTKEEARFTPLPENLLINLIGCVLAGNPNNAILHQTNRIHKFYDESCNDKMADKICELMNPSDNTDENFTLVRSGNPEPEAKEGDVTDTNVGGIKDCQCEELMRDSIDPDLCAFCGSDFRG